MASLLRQIVSGPRARHPEAGLDLCYVTNDIIATSGPSGTFPQLAYRTPLKQLVKFLDDKHGDQWAIWEFRGEGTGYPDSEVYDRIYHYPWPDHHPPPFALIPIIMGSMRNWLKGDNVTNKRDNEETCIVANGEPEPALKCGDDAMDKHTAETRIDANGHSEPTSSMGSPVPQQATSPQQPQEYSPRLEQKTIPQTKSRELASKLAAIKISPDDGTTNISAAEDPPSLPPTPSYPADPNMLTLPPGASGVDSSTATSPSASGTSTPGSVRRKKEVRWRESTLLPPKEQRGKSPSSPEMDKSSSRSKHSKKDGTKSPTSTTDDSKSRGKSRGLLSRKKPDLDRAEGKMLKSTASASEGREGTAVFSEKNPRVVVVHCKAGKGRSGTVSCSYLISQEGWSVTDALARFTERRMRPGFGAGVSIPSQLRWIGYVERWTKGGKRYVERGLEVLEVHVWGMRDRVKVSVEGFAEEGRKTETVHSFTKEERTGREEKKGGLLAGAGDALAAEKERRRIGDSETSGMGVGESIARAEEEKDTNRSKTAYEGLQGEDGGGDVVFRPSKRIITQTGDVNIDFERRNKGVSGLNMVTSVAHVWFNAYFEGNGPERDGRPLESGVFEIEWDKMDGIKGSSRKGTRAFDKLAVVWKAIGEAEKPGVVINMPTAGEGVKDVRPADWRGGDDKDATRDLGDEVDSGTSRMESQTSLSQNQETESIKKGAEVNARPN